MTFGVAKSPSNVINSLNDYIRKRSIPVKCKCNPTKKTVA